MFSDDVACYVVRNPLSLKKRISIPGLDGQKAEIVAYINVSISPGRRRTGEDILRFVTAYPRGPK